MIAVAVAGCTRTDDVRSRASSSAEPPLAACPPDAFLESLHAAAFHFQHGPAAKGREYLDRARTLAPAALDGESRRILDQLSEVSRLVSSDPDRAALETEYVRLHLSDWGCLRSDLHRTFHGRLPPIPGGTP
jgi:hypothetical protein